MSDNDKTNSGALFKNDKQGNDKRPDYRGSINVAGTEFWLSAWLNTIKSGENKGGKYMALKLQPKEKPASEPPPAKKDFDDDIPF